MNTDKEAQSMKLLWMDLEMTGLDPEQHVITEIAVEITDWDFTTLATYEAVIFQPDEVLDKSSEWVKNQDIQSGLFDHVRTKGRPEQEVVRELVQLIKHEFGDASVMLAGNSIHQDRRFIRKWWPEVEALLHYRMLDVSSWKVVMAGKYGVGFEKQEQHRAAVDIRESIAELEYYLAWLKDGKHA
jgi:oligoribonuclease